MHGMLLHIFPWLTETLLIFFNVSRYFKFIYLWLRWVFTVVKAQALSSCGGWWPLSSRAAAVHGV